MVSPPGMAISSRSRAPTFSDIRFSKVKSGVGTSCPLETPGYRWPNSRICWGSFGNHLSAVAPRNPGKRASSACYGRSHTQTVSSINMKTRWFLR